MRLFRKKARQPESPVLPEHADWVHEGLFWLYEVLFIDLCLPTVEFNDSFFPAYHQEPTEENLLQDILSLLGLSEDKVSMEAVTGIEDQVWYGIEGLPFLSDLQPQEDGTYKIHYAAFLSRFPRFLVNQLVYECCHVYLEELGIKIQAEENLTEASDVREFLYLACITLGFGWLLGESWSMISYEADSVLERSMNITPSLETAVFGYALAVHTSILEIEVPEKILQSEVERYYHEGCQYIDALSPKSLSLENLPVGTAISLAHQRYRMFGFDSAIDIIENLMSRADLDAETQAYLFNNRGYYTLLNGNIQEAIADLNRCVSLLPDYGFGFENLAWAHLELNALEEAEAYIGKANDTKNNNRGYSLKNQAVLAFKRGAIEDSLGLFDQAWEHRPVDRLAYHHAIVLDSLGRTSEAIRMMEDVWLPDPVEVELLESLKKK